MGDPVVRLERVHRSFGDVVALDDFSVDLPPGCIAMLLGPNGAGKTTAVRVVTGALPPDAGTVHVFGLDPATDGTEVRRRCGVVPARPALYDRLTGWDNLRYGADLYGIRGEEPIRAAAARFEIAHALDQRVGGYSTGMRARLALARATLHDPDLLLLDEPTAGLDPESARAVLELIREMAGHGRSVLMCTHLLLEAEGLADHVMVMDHGRTLVSGSPRELTRRFWDRPTVVLEADDGTAPTLDGLRDVTGVVSFHRDVRRALVEVDGPARIPEIVAAAVGRGARLVRVEPREPTLEELYFAVRRAERAAPTWRPPTALDAPMVPADRRPVEAP